MAIPNHPCRILITGSSGSSITNSLFNLVKHQPDIHKIHLYAKDPYEAKYEFLVNKLQSTGLNKLNHNIAFIKHSNDMDDTYENIKECNPNKKRKILNALDDMIADMFSNKNFNLVVTELFIRGRKNKHYPCFCYTILSCCTKKYLTKFYTLF